jgi:hypothetical protein
VSLIGCSVRRPWRPSFSRRPLEYATGLKNCGCPSGVCFASNNGVPESRSARAVQGHSRNSAEPYSITSSAAASIVWEGEPERLGGIDVDQKFKFGWLLDGKIN